MRIDKFLWAIRVFKTRSLASAHCREGKVFIGEKAVKPAQSLLGDERIRVRKGAVVFEWKVLLFPKSRVGAALVETYARDITPAQELKKWEDIRAAQRNLSRPVGRPTKRDRRDWEKHFE
tara:strand:- start:29 stop:388 length:360 start_codon:yes stop_codon:yes gene_type:complete